MSKHIYYATIETPKPLSDRQRTRLELAIADILRIVFDITFDAESPAPYVYISKEIDHDVRR
jgi:F0F1-type ATP synthase delta subunit